MLFRWAGHGYEEALPVVTLWGRRWTRPELLARVGRLEQGAGIRLVEGGDGPDDASVFNYPHRATETYGLHGRYTGLPARLAGYGTAWDGDDCVLWAEGEVLQAAVFGEQLLLRRRIEADLGGVSLRISDTVTNIGPTRCPHMLLYHCNIGFPVVDDGSELVYPSVPGTCVSAACSPGYQRLTGPGGDFEEECYEHDAVKAFAREVRGLAEALA